MQSNSQPASDQEVAAAVCAGDTERFGELVQRYRPALLRVARSRLRSETAAEDVVQETFLCAFRFLASYNTRFQFRTWIWTILLNQCRRRESRRARQASRRRVSGRSAGEPDAPAPEALQEPATAEPGPPEAAIARETAERLESLLGKLPRAQADAIRLRFYGGLTFPEIASALGCGLSTAKCRVRWGLEKLAALLTTPRCGEIPPTDPRVDSL